MGTDVVVVVAAVLSILAVLIYITQKVSDLSYGASFYLSIAAFIFFLVSACALAVQRYIVDYDGYVGF